VVGRFVAWEPELPPAARAYVDAVWQHKLVAEWIAAAAAEPWLSPKYETAAA
jgi:hypothetical protein